MKVSDWKNMKLGDVITLKRGYDLPQNNRVHGKIPVYSSAGLSGYHNEYKVKGPGVITGRYGTLGEVFFTDSDYWPHNTTLYVQNYKGNHPKFIYYFLKTLGFANSNDKTSVPGVNRNDLHEINVTIPSKETQVRISEILSSIDEKIELNRQTAQTLEAIAQAIFKEWFVDFNFPGATGEMHESELGEIPKGWKVDALSEVISIKHGYAFKGEYFSDEETDDILLTPGNFKIGGGFNYSKFKYYKGDFPYDYILRQGDIIVTMTDLSKDGDTLGYSAIVPAIEGKRLLHNQRIGKVLFKEKDFNHFLYFVLQQNDYRNFVLGSATGSTVRHTSPPRICEYRSVIPQIEILNKFNQSIKPTLATIESKIQENKILTQLRDSLLPKLMKGEIKI